MPEVSGLLEAAIYVDDLDRSVEFYQELLDFTLILQSDRGCALSVADEQVLVILKKGKSRQARVTPGGTIPATEGEGTLHVAFSIATDDLEEWKEWLEENGVEIESTVQWARGGQSLYFRDPDNHVVELVTPGCWTIY